MLVTPSGMTYDVSFIFLNEMILLLSLLNRMLSSKIKFGDKHSNLPSHLKNGLPFKQITLFGMDIYFNEEHPQNASSPMLVTLSGITILLKDEKAKAPLPMLVTLLGITTLRKEEQPQNASSPMLVTPSGMTMSDRELHPPKCTIPNVGYTVWYDNVRQRIATRKYPISNTSNTVRNNEATQRRATIKCTIPNACDTARNFEAFQRFAITKCTNPYTSNTIRNNNTA